MAVRSLMGPAMEVLPFHSLIGTRCLPYLEFKSIILSPTDSGVQKLPKGGNYVITMDKRVSCALLPVQKLANPPMGSIHESAFHVHALGSLFDIIETILSPKRVQKIRKIVANYHEILVGN
jgi:hypothetical protein